MKKTDEQIISNGKPASTEEDVVILDSNSSSIEGANSFTQAGFNALSDKPKFSLLEKAEAFISKLSTKNNFWNAVCSLIWLPFAFSSGLKMTKDDNAAILPFRRFNKNWYNAMAGAILLGNSEIAGGTYVFKKCKGLYRVVCKKLEYRFLRPCIGPAIYKMNPRENIDKLIATGKEFNINLDMVICQIMRAPHEKERRVGKCCITMHASPIIAKKKKR